MKLYTSEDKDRIVRHVWEYRKRRDKLREIYGVINGRRAPDEYKKKAKKINNKIRQWQHTIKMVERRTNQLIAIANELAYYTCINVRNSIDKITPEYRKARNIYYKYCLEIGIPATLIAEYVGASRGDVVARGRLSFNRSFEKHPENRELYVRFRDYINDLTQQNRP